MAGAEEILAAIEALYAAGLDADQWPQALAALMRTVGGVAATLEIYGRPALQLKEFHSFGVPPADRTTYLADFLAINPRLPVVFKLKPGRLLWDNMVLDERAMKRDAFYSDFLTPQGFRYFVRDMSITTPSRACSSCFPMCNGRWTWRGALRVRPMCAPRSRAHSAG
jgi:hypothetical protein